MLVLLKQLLMKSYYSILFRDNLINKNVLVGKGYFLSRKNSVSIIGERIYIGPNCHVGTNLDIHSDVLIASSVSFVGGDHAFSDIDVPMFSSGRSSQVGVILENNTWIGHGSIIMDGVTIREGSIVAAGAVVTKSFPSFSIIGGNPARLIRGRE